MIASIWNWIAAALLVGIFVAFWHRPQTEIEIPETETEWGKRTERRMDALRWKVTQNEMAVEAIRSHLGLPR